MGQPLAAPKRDINPYCVTLSGVPFSFTGRQAVFIAAFLAGKRLEEMAGDLELPSPGSIASLQRCRLIEPQGQQAHRCLVPGGDENFFTLQCPPDEIGRLFLGLLDGDGCHDAAIQGNTCGV
jgi:hypothetical protein